MSILRFPKRPGDRNGDADINESSIKHTIGQLEANLSAGLSLVDLGARGRRHGALVATEIVIENVGSKGGLVAIAILTDILEVICLLPIHDELREDIVARNTGEACTGQHHRNTKSRGKFHFTRTRCFWVEQKRMAEVKAR